MSVIGMNAVDNIAGWVLVAASFLGYYWLLPKPFRQPGLVIVGALVLVAHHVLSYFNIANGPLVFAKYDAWGFHLFAEKFAGQSDQLQWAIGTPMYKSLLLVLYDSLGRSQWLGQSFSILCFAISMAVLLRIARRLDINNMVILAALLLVYGLSPSGLIYGSIMLREPIMTLAFMVGCGIIISAFDRRDPYCLVLAALCWLVMGLFHQVMMVFALALSIISFAMYVGMVARRAPQEHTVPGEKSRFAVSGGKLILVLGGFVAIAVTVIFWWLPSTGGDDYFAMFFDSIPRSIALYRGAGESSLPTTAYNAVFEFDNWWKTIVSLTLSYFYYIGWPLGGDYSWLGTWALMVGGVMRLTALLVVPWVRHHWIWAGLVVYFAMTLIWNIGTTNHGQALRHHMMTDWLLLLVLANFSQFWWQRARSTKPQQMELKQKEKTSATRLGNQP